MFFLTLVTLIRSVMVAFLTLVLVLLTLNDIIGKREPATQLSCHRTFCKIWVSDLVSCKFGFIICPLLVLIKLILSMYLLWLVTFVLSDAWMS